MTLKEANRELEHLENELNRLLNEKELLFIKTQPKGVEIKLDPIRSSNRSDKYLDYVISVEEKQIDEQVDLIYSKRNNIQGWITGELKILKKYNDLEQMIRYYKEDYTIENPKGRTQPITWEEISKMVYYSPSYCRRIYKEYKKKRETE